jgi:uncharacterized membrane protein
MGYTSGFALKFDTIATVVIAGLVTGLVAGLTPMDILTTLGNSFLTNRTATLFVLTLPVIGICERFGLKDKAVDLIKSIKKATVGKVVSIYQVIRAFAATFSLRIGGHPQFVRPIVNPMAQAAAIAKYGPTDVKTEDEIKGLCAASENYGNFFGQNCFMGASGTLLIVTTLTEQGFTDVNALNVAANSWYICIAALLLGLGHNYLYDRKLEKRYRLAAAQTDDTGKGEANK